jgi:hypothetical protein
MTPEEVTVRFQLAMDGATGLPPEGIDQIEMLIRVGEQLVAFEALCTQIDEYEISLEPDLVQQLIEVGLAVGAEERYSDLLRDTQVMWHRSARKPSRTEKRRWSPLWWALPLAFVVVLPLWWVAGFSMCGISGCSGGGFGVSDIGRGSVLPILAVSGAVLALPVVLTHWHARRWVRVAVGLGVAATWAGANVIWMYSWV